MLTYNHGTQSDRHRVRNEKRVTMRVKVKVQQTSLPLAHDEMFTDAGSYGVKFGEHDIVVYESDVAKVMAKVETNTAALQAAHDTFWRACLEAVKAKIASTGQFIDHDLLVVPDEPGGSANRWVETKWPKEAKVLYFAWLTRECDEGSRNPEAIFRLNVGRGPYPLAWAKLLGDVEKIDAPVPPEGQAVLALGEVLGAAFNRGGTASAASPEVAALKAENAALREQQAETNRKLDALLAKLGESSDAPKNKRA